MLLDLRIISLFLLMVLFKKQALVLKLLVLELSSLRYLDLDLHLLPSLMLVLKQTLMLLKLFLLLKLETLLTYKVKQMTEKLLLLNLPIHLLHLTILDLSLDKVLKVKQF